MGKIYFHAPREQWIVDRFGMEWTEHNQDITTFDPYAAKTIWLCADWAFDQLPYALLRSKRVMTTIHHITPEKFTPQERDRFRMRDEITDLYHVPCEKTRAFISPLTNKPIWISPFWVDERVFFPQANKRELREKYGLPQNRFVVGSWMRDSEGSDLSCKKEKGADIIIF